ncbi:hypothetical protein BC830DRAFT_1079084 [Chytriomyces sp. MP71]|nr:hypothetical protein BC830DRAFT_1079084 [Chytriomyces sp. MP71]
MSIPLTEQYVPTLPHVERVVSIDSSQAIVTAESDAPSSDQAGLMLGLSIPLFVTIVSCLAVLLLAFISVLCMMRRINRIIDSASEPSKFSFASNHPGAGSKVFGGSNSGSKRKAHSFHFAESGHGRLAPEAETLSPRKEKDASFNVLEVGNRYKARLAYHRNLEDEIDVARGDDILIKHIFDDGWIFVLNRTAWKKGFMPAACLEDASVGQNDANEMSTRSKHRKSSRVSVADMAEIDPEFDYSSIICCGVAHTLKCRVGDFKVKTGNAVNMTEKSKHIAIYGATGRTGVLVTETLLARGSQLTALCRDPAKLPTSLRNHNNLAAIKGDINSNDAVAQLLAKAEIALLAVGIETIEPVTIVTDAVQSIVTAHKNGNAPNLKQVYLISSAGAGSDISKQPWVYRFIIHPLVLRHVYIDLERAENLLKEFVAFSPDLHYTIFRPPQIISMPKNKDVYVYEEQDASKHAKSAGQITYGDFADVIVKTIETHEYAENKTVRVNSDTYLCGILDKRGSARGVLWLAFKKYGVPALSLTLSAVAAGVYMIHRG